jgi:NADH:ubiquinone reductase (H+-translocating)
MGPAGDRPGSVTRLQSTRGLADHARGFKTVSEAVYLRNHVLEELEAADTVDDLGDRRAAATFVVIGAGYAGTELVAELEAMSRRAVGRYRRLDRGDLRWVLVNRSDRVLPELGPRLGREAVQVLRRGGSTSASTPPWRRSAAAGCGCRTGRRSRPGR